MSIDNFDKIIPFLSFENPDLFYFIQIIQRKKEHPELGRNNRCVKTFYIYSLNKLEEYKQEIIDLCHYYKARAYIHLSPRNRKVLLMDLLLQSALQVKLEQFDNVHNIYNSMCGQNKGESKLWLVDVDTKDENIVDNVQKAIHNSIPITSKIKLILETKNGFHFICIPFSVDSFTKNLKDLGVSSLDLDSIEIHKNNPTILYTI